MESITIDEATTAIEPIPSYRPDAKARRYDRQLRLWASSGQKSLESSRVLLINPDAAGSQALKNLVLPGISHFTILSPPLPSSTSTSTSTSPRVVTPRDISTNFFLLPESLGEEIAGEVKRLLEELNPAVEGRGVEGDPAQILLTDPSFYTSFSLIIGSNLDPKFERDLSAFLWSASDNEHKTPDVPFITVRTSGFVAKMRSQYREHCVIDSHPEHHHDIRIESPFPELKEYAMSLDLEKMDSMEHSHVPYLVLLVRSAGMYEAEQAEKEKAAKESVTKEVNSTDTEMDEGESNQEQTKPAEIKVDPKIKEERIKEILLSERRALDEENFEEALKQAYHVCREGKIPSDIERLLNDPACENASKESKDFWILVKALKAYTLHPSNTSHLLPLVPSLPDMHSSTASYVALQNLYKARAQKDTDLFKECLRDVLEKVGLEGDAISEEDVDGFVKHSQMLLCERGKELKVQLEKGDVVDDLLDEMNSNDHGAAINIAFHLAENHQIKTGSFPGLSDDTYDAQKNQLFEKFKELVGMPELGKRVELDEDGDWVEKESEGDGMDTAEDEDGDVEDEIQKVQVIYNSIDEVMRGGMGVLPTTAALVGGMVAQEGIKLITSQYPPLNGTCIADLVKGGITRYDL